MNAPATKTQNKLKPAQRFGQLLNSPQVQRQVGEALVDTGISVAKFMSCVRLSARRDAKLLTCTPESLVQSFLDSAATGILPDGRHGYLIPYGKECKFMAGYLGMIQVMYRFLKGASISGDVVREHDEFDESMRYVHQHKVDRSKTAEERGKIIAAWLRVVMPGDAPEHHHVIGLDRIEAAKKSSQSGNVWRDHEEAQVLKTCVRDSMRFMPQGENIENALLAAGAMTAEPVESEAVGDDAAIDVEVVDETPEPKPAKRGPQKAEKGRKAKPDSKPPEQQEMPVAGDRGRLVGQITDLMEEKCPEQDSRINAFSAWCEEYGSNRGEPLGMGEWEELDAEDLQSLLKFVAGARA